MWTPDRDEMLREMGPGEYAAAYGKNIDETCAKYLILVDPDGQATLLRERNRGVEEKAGCTRQDEPLKRGGVRWTQDEDQNARRVHVVGLGNAEMARRLEAAHEKGRGTAAPKGVPAPGRALI